MLRIIFSFLQLCILLPLFATNPVVINGVWTKRNPKEVKLFAVEGGTLTELASSELLADKTFHFTFSADYEGFYVVGQSLNSARDNYTFYLKPGDLLNVEIGYDGCTLTGENTAENKEMVRWNVFKSPLESKTVYFMENSSTYVDFFPLLEDKLRELPDFRQQVVKNERFNEAFEMLQENDILFYAMQLLRTPRTAHPQTEDYPDYYRNLSLRDFANFQLLNYPYGIDLLAAYQMTYPMFSPEDKGALKNDVQRCKDMLENVTNEVIKGEIVLMSTRNLRTEPGFNEFEKEFGRYLTTNTQKLRMKEVLKKIRANTENGIAKITNDSQKQSAIDFNFPDVSGKEVALSDFRGKLVYVDVWATWCMPCRGEIPELKKLEEEYHDKNIVFMSVSTDVDKDYEKWKTFIVENELKGVQLFGGNRAKETISRSYKITGIPRFILVGSDGNLISADAPRPTSPEVRAMLNAALGD